ncbi:MAG: hypothetical protein LBU32_21955 [Clostridiales bacterium]|jgi:hypothetical protein|nr:hypothetical protein [Clostridiales bacterium]
MGILDSFYQEANYNNALKSDFDSFEKRYAEDKMDRETAIQEIIAIGKKHGTVLSRKDFDEETVAFDEREISAAAAANAVSGSSSVQGYPVIK